MLIAAPDLHSSYGDLVQKYFVAQGLSCKHRVCIVDRDAGEFVKDLVWTPRSRIVAPSEDDDENGVDNGGQKIKIAWRYEQMKQFQTTVSSYVSPSATSRVN